MLLSNRVSIKNKVVMISTLCSALCLSLAAVVILVLVFMRSEVNAVETNTLIADIVGFQASAALAFGSMQAT